MDKEQNLEKLNKFFDRVKNVGFFERLFFWKNVVSLSYDAYEEFKSVDKRVDQLNRSLSEREVKIRELENDLKNEQKLIAKSESDLKIAHAKLESNTKEIQDNVKEMGALREAKSKNEENIHKIEKELEVTKSKLDLNNKDLQVKIKELGGLREAKEKNESAINSLEKDLEVLKSKNEILLKDNKEDEKALVEYRKFEKKNQEEYEKKVAELNSLKKQLDDDRLKVQAEREREIKENFEKMRRAWKNHETTVEESIKTICKKYSVEYVDKEKVPFKGKPDNTLRICEEYVIFDAKSPAGDDLTSFSKYLRSQMESLSKYAKHDSVKKDIFLVVPDNTLEVIDDFYHNLADYRVFVVSLDSLEPIILSLMKIEEYEFAEQMTPEERESVCRVIGKFAHTTKRRIQNDNFFNNEMISILTQCNSLPKEILDKSIEFEKSDKLNPPMEKRVKTISERELKHEIDRIGQEKVIRELDLEDTQDSSKEQIEYHESGSKKRKSKD